MWWWRDLIAPIISACVVSGITSWSIIRNKKKKNKEKFTFEIKALCQELEGNFQGRGNEIPFQIFWLKNILKNSFFRKKYPKICNQAIQCLVIAGDKKGKKPSEIQQAMRSLKESIDNNILNSIKNT